MKKICAGLLMVDVLLILLGFFLSFLSSSAVIIRGFLWLLGPVNLWAWRYQKKQNLFTTGEKAFLVFALNAFLVFLPLLFLVREMRLAFFVTPPFSWLFFSGTLLYPLALLGWGVANSILYLVQLSRLDSRKPWE